MMGDDLEDDDLEDNQYVKSPRLSFLMPWSCHFGSKTLGHRCGILHVLYMYCTHIYMHGHAFTCFNMYLHALKCIYMH